MNELCLINTIHQYLIEQPMLMKLYRLYIMVLHVLLFFILLGMTVSVTVTFFRPSEATTKVIRR